MPPGCVNPTKCPKRSFPASLPRKSHSRSGLTDSVRAAEPLQRRHPITWNRCTCGNSAAGQRVGEWDLAMVPLSERPSAPDSATGAFFVFGVLRPKGETNLQGGERNALENYASDEDWAGWASRASEWRGGIYICALGVSPEAAADRRGRRAPAVYGGNTNRSHRHNRKRRNHNRNRRNRRLPLPAVRATCECQLSLCRRRGKSPS